MYKVTVWLCSHISSEHLANLAKFGIGARITVDQPGKPVVIYNSDNYSPEYHKGIFAAFGVASVSTNLIKDR